MTTATGMTPGLEARLRGPRAHRLLVADTDRQRRVGAAAWVTRELAQGAKVYYKGWLPDGIDADAHWIVGPHGATGAREAFASGQLEFLDYPTVIQRCGGTTHGLLRLQTAEVERALDEGWRSVAMSQETTYRAMADEDEAAEFAAQERGYDHLAARWPLNTLCQLTVDEENKAASWESAAVHNNGIADTHWWTAVVEGRWQPAGDLEAHIGTRFGAAVYGALRSARQSPGGGSDLHVDLSAVAFMDVACAQILLLAARSAQHHQRMVLHQAPRFLRDLLDRVGRPRAVLFDDEQGAR